MEEDDIRALLPLTSKAFHILTALAGKPMNGYRLGLRVEEATEGAIKMSPGTLYENVHRLAAQGLIREVEGGRGLSTDGRGQRFYEISDTGREVLHAEVARLARDLKLARSVPGLAK